MKGIWLVILALFIGIIIWGGILLNTASPQQYDSRLFNLEGFVNRLESRINQIEAQLGRSRRVPSSGAVTIPPTSSSRSRRTVSPQERDQMFDRLATLVVELKQQVNELEGRIAKLEKRG